MSSNQQVTFVRDPKAISPVMAGFIEIGAPLGVMRRVIYLAEVGFVKADPAEELAELAQVDVYFGNQAAGFLGMACQAQDGLAGNRFRMHFYSMVSNAVLAVEFWLQNMLDPATDCLNVALIAAFEVLRQPSGEPMKGRNPRTYVTKEMQLAFVGQLTLKVPEREAHDATDI